ncbi:hypothetical protein CR513_60152, partial [Mucuna pruriens]
MEVPLVHQRDWRPPSREWRLTIEESRRLTTEEGRRLATKKNLGGDIRSEIESDSEESEIRKQPFVDVIINTPLLIEWKNLSLNKYDGTMDPIEHINAYVTQVNQYINKDVILCRVFPTFLKGATLNWYTHLPHRSIDLFKILVANCAGESQARGGQITPHFHRAFRSYNREDQRSELKGCLHSMIMVLKHGMFSNNLCKKTPTSMDELRARALTTSR